MQLDDGEGGGDDPSLDQDLQSSRPHGPSSRDCQVDVPVSAVQRPALSYQRQYPHPWGHGQAKEGRG